MVKQISLATRDKVQTPPIFYPPVYVQNRPGSASLHSTQRNRFVARNCVSTKKRPLSADSRFIRNNLKETHRVKFDLDKVGLNFAWENFNDLENSFIFRKLQPPQTTF